MKLVSFTFSIMIILYNCHYSVDSYKRKYNINKLNVGVLSTKATIDCSNNTSNFFKFRSNSLERKIRKQLNEKTLASRIDPDINETIDLNIIWLNCDNIGGEFLYEEEKESKLKVLYSTIAFGTLAIFPVPVKSRYYLEFQALIGRNLCKSSQPVRHGMIIHIFHLPLSIFNFTDLVNHDLLSPAIDRGLDEILEQYSKGKCEKY